MERKRMRGGEERNERLERKERSTSCKCHAASNKKHTARAGEAKEEGERGRDGQREGQERERERKKQRKRGRQIKYGRHRNMRPHNWPMGLRSVRVPAVKCHGMRW